MANTGIINKLLQVSPVVELFVRKIYWNNVNFLNRFKYLKKKSEHVFLNNFDKITNHLKNNGVKEGSLLVLHSSFDALEKTGKTPQEIIDILINLIGPKGTIAMNSARKFKGESYGKDYLKEENIDYTLVYDVKKSKVWTGVLPFYMVRHKDAKISRFPINPMVAVGFLAEEMMKNNLTGDLKSCGNNSSWKFCVDNDAIVIGVGIDLVHSLTIMHVAEDNSDWPIKKWYRERKYKIIDDNFEKEVVVKERMPKWGTLHFAERTLCKDLLNNKILKSVEIDGVLVEMLKAKDLIDFLQSKNKNGYPYFCLKNK